MQTKIKNIYYCCRRYTILTQISQLPNVVEGMSHIKKLGLSTIVV